MTIYYICPDKDIPIGGIKKIYDHADILNKYKLQASVLHSLKGFRCTWFKNQTKITYRPEVTLSLSDFLVFPENFGPNFTGFIKGPKKVIFNQNCYCTFTGYEITTPLESTSYLDKKVAGIIVVSEDSQAYLHYAFPNISLYRVHNSIDPNLFSYSLQKKKQICFMPRKGKDNIIQVITILRFKNLLNGYDLIPIENKTPSEVAAIFKDSLIFLSFSEAEGFGLPSAEAMACGCIVIGYNGQGGKEFLQPNISYPVESKNIIGFCKTIEQVIKDYENNPAVIKKKSAQAAAFIKNNYSPELEERDLLTAWTKIIQNANHS